MVSGCVIVEGQEWSKTAFVQVELREFDFSQWSHNVRKLTEYRWKAILWAA